MARFYSVKAPTRRWPLQIFYNILNLALINSWILYKKINRTRISRRDYIIKLIEEIEEKFVVKSGVGGAKRKESTSEGTPKRVRHLTNEVDELMVNEKKRCQVKFMCLDNKSIRVCERCNKSACGKCIGIEFIRATCRQCIEIERNENFK